MAYHKWSSFILKVHPTYPLKQQFFKILFLVIRAASGGVAAERGTGRAGRRGLARATVWFQITRPRALGAGCNA